jgi:glycosyltransferase involved in cell wall biosynthesis
MSPEEVGKAMEKADIYVLPSNQQEGWGAVVNEAMSRGCCVIGSKSAGSVPWLIRDGVNGYIFDGDDAENLGRILLRCLEAPDRTREMGRNARATMLNLWSPEVAAERFLQLCAAIESGKSSPFNDGGPCSPALMV